MKLKKLPKKLRTLLPILLVAVTGTVLLARTLAASTTMYFSPASVSVTQGNQFQSQLRINSGGSTVSSFRASFSWDQKISYVSYNSGGSPYNLSVFPSSNSLLIDGWQKPGATASGDHLVVTLTFSANSQGSGSITFTSYNTFVTTSPYQSLTTQGQSYTVNAPSSPPSEPPAPPADQGGGGGGSTSTPPPASGSGGGSSGSSKKSTKKPTVSVVTETPPTVSVQETPVAQPEVSVEPTVVPAPTPARLTTAPKGGLSARGIITIIVIGLLASGGVIFFVLRRRRLATAGDHFYNPPESTIDTGPVGEPSPPLSGEPVVHTSLPDLVKLPKQPQAKAEEPPDMFELAKEHPETYGSPELLPHEQPDGSSAPKSSASAKKSPQA